MTLDSAFIDPTPTLPELPSLAEYQRLPDITAAHQEIHQQLATRQQRLLAAYVHKDGWAWPSVWQNELRGVMRGLGTVGRFFSLMFCEKSMKNHAKRVKISHVHKNRQKITCGTLFF